MLNVKWIDDIKINLGDQIVMMKKMLYVFELNANLFSISTFNRRGFVIIFNEKTVEIQNKSILIVIEIVKNRMYMLQSINTTFLSSEAKIPEKLKETINFWYNLWWDEWSHSWKKRGYYFWKKRAGHFSTVTWTFRTREIDSIENAVYADARHECDQRFWRFRLQGM